MKLSLMTTLLMLVALGFTSTSFADDPQKKSVFVSTYGAHLGSLGDTTRSDEALGFGFGVSDRAAIELSGTNFYDLNAYWLGGLFSLYPPGGRFDP